MRNLKMGVLLTSMLVCLGLVFSAWAKTGKREPTTAYGALLGTNGLSAPERQKFYHLPEGSELYPYAWAKALISSQTSKPFLENLERFGLIPDPKSQDNPYGLPIGITVAKRRGVGDIQMIGVNCAACHVGQFSYGGQDFRADGAPNLFDIQMFYADLAISTKETIKDPDRLWAFIKRYLAEKEAPAESVPAAPISASGKGGEARAYKFGDGTRKLLDSFSDLKAMTNKGALRKRWPLRFRQSSRKKSRRPNGITLLRQTRWIRLRKNSTPLLKKTWRSCLVKTPALAARSIRLSAAGKRCCAKS